MKRFFTLLLIFIALSKTVFSQTDTAIGLDLPGNYASDKGVLAATLCVGASTERAKANAIYNWITHNIAYDVNALWKLNNAGEDESVRALKTKKAICTGYSDLYVGLCRSAGLSAVKIYGYAKDMFFDNGDEMYIPRHEWCAVKVDGKWGLVDATWGSGYLYQSTGWITRMLIKLHIQKKQKKSNLKFKFRYDPQYFLQDPKVFRQRHMPVDPMWQLSDTTMPLAVFEAGDSAIKKFNAISKPQQSSEMLDKIALLGDNQREFEFADRAYKFNRRFPVVLARKNAILADTAIKELEYTVDPRKQDSILRAVTTNMKEALGHIKKQRKNFPEEYSKLGKKNTLKSADAKQYIRQIKTDDKRMLALTKQHAKSANTKYARANKKMTEVRKRGSGLDANRIDHIETTKMQKKASSPELLQIDDSVGARMVRIEKMKLEHLEKEMSMAAALQNNKKLLDSLALALVAEDSLLRNEASARLGMQDSYDDEVKLWSSLLRKQKYTVTDTLLKYYFAGFDSIAAHYEDLHKDYLTALNTHKSNVRSLEQYKKWNNRNEELKTKYSSTIENYVADVDSATYSIQRYQHYLKQNKEVFGVLSKLGKHQLKITAFMEKAEKSRQDLESRTLARKKYTDLKENDRQKNSVQNVLKKIEKARNS